MDRLPSVNKKGKVGNYVWISYFCVYLDGTGRAGFVMSSQATCAGGHEATVRCKLGRIHTTQRIEDESEHDEAEEDDIKLPESRG